MKAEKIAQKARDSLNRFCYEECNAFCCRNCYLPLDQSNVDIVTQGRTKELINKKILKKFNNGRYSLYLGNHDYPCPSLKDFKCTIYKNPKRPKVCDEFPLFLEKNLIKLSPRCLAVQKDLLFPYVKQLLALGYKIAKPGEMSFLGLYDIELKK